MPTAPGLPPNRGYSSENTLKQLIVFTMQTRKIVGASSGTVIRKKDVVLVYHKAKEAGEKEKPPRAVNNAREAADRADAGTQKSKQGRKKGK